MTKLVLLRHGESIWNKENLFTGWYDVDLSEQGKVEAKRAGELLKAEGFTFDVAYTSVLKRALISPEKGADTLVWLATTEPGTQWVSGEYYEKRRIAKANAQAADAGLARELWERSAAMVELAD